MNNTYYFLVTVYGDRALHQVAVAVDEKNDAGDISDKAAHFAEPESQAFWLNCIKPVYEGGRVVGVTEILGVVTAQ